LRSAFQRDDRKALLLLMPLVGNRRIGRYVVLELAEVAVPRVLFAEILRRTDRLRVPPVAA
jgi:hypothetical protein